MERHAEFMEHRLQQAIVQLFGEMPPETYAGVRRFFKWVDLPGGSHLFRQGAPGGGMYILASGRLKVMRHMEDGALGEAEIPPGEPVGEMALITGEARTADVLAMRDCVLARLEKADFDALVAAYPNALLSISKTIIERLQERENRPRRRRKSITNICLLPIAGRDEAEFSEKLAAALAPFGSTLLLTSERVGALMGQPGIAQASRQSVERYRVLSTWLEMQETSHRFVLYLPDESDTEWTRRCIRHADEVLLLGDGSAPPQLHWMETEFLQGRNRLSIARKTLALLHPPDCARPRGTKNWLAQRDVAMHHHLRRGSEQDLARLARFLSGNATGLVLSGGAARGAAHVGVFRALEEGGVPVDVVGGTSIGAIMGAFIALGMSSEEIRRRTRHVFLGNPTSDFNLLPRVSIFKGRKLERLLDEAFGNTEMEDLWLNCYCVSCNLSKTNPHVHQRGRLVEAIRASISIPGVFPPAELGDELFVDGGVFNNMPVDVMNRMGVGSIVAVDLQAYHQPAEPEELEKKKRLPNLLYVVMESSMLSGRYLNERHRKDADWYINPPLRKFGLMDWQSFDKMEAVGYEHARAFVSKSNNAAAAP